MCNRDFFLQYGYLHNVYGHCNNRLSKYFLGKFRYFHMNQQTLLEVLTAYTLVQRQMLLTLELLMNDNKHLPQTPFDTRHRIRQFAYIRMIHKSDVVCRQSTRMDRWTFAIICHLIRTVSGLSSTEIVDFEEMVAMFLYILAHDVMNHVIQRELVWSGETVSRYFNLVLLAVLWLHDELIKKPVSVTNNCNDERWKCFEVRVVEVVCDVSVHPTNVCAFV